jgi:hypothetical protein
LSATVVQERHEQSPQSTPRRRLLVVLQGPFLARVSRNVQKSKTWTLAKVDVLSPPMLGGLLAVEGRRPLGSQLVPDLEVNFGYC